MKAKLADYILKLRRSSEETRQAEDRRHYELLLADAGVLLALAVTEADADIVEAALKSHERLWGNTWLKDDIFREPNDAWQQVKRNITEEFGHPCNHQT